jgi:hypothetical protein
MRALEIRLRFTKKAGRKKEGPYGRTAPLSPHQEVSLRRVALGVCQPADLPVGNITRLKALSLIEAHGTGLRLTPLGLERYLGDGTRNGIAGVAGLSHVRDLGPIRA